MICEQFGRVCIVRHQDGVDSSYSIAEIVRCPVEVLVGGLYSLWREWGTDQAIEVGGDIASANHIARLIGGQVPWRGIKRIRAGYNHGSGCHKEAGDREKVAWRFEDGHDLTMCWM